MLCVYFVSQRQAEAFPKHRGLGREARLASPPLCTLSSPLTEPLSHLHWNQLFQDLNHPLYSQYRLAPLCPSHWHISRHMFWQFDEVNRPGPLPSDSESKARPWVNDVGFFPGLKSR